MSIICYYTVITFSFNTVKLCAYFLLNQGAASKRKTYLQRIVYSAGSLHRVSSLASEAVTPRGLRGLGPTQFLCSSSINLHVLLHVLQVILCAENRSVGLPGNDIQSSCSVFLSALNKLKVTGDAQ